MLTTYYLYFKDFVSKINQIHYKDYGLLAYMKRPVILNIRKNPFKNNDNTSYKVLYVKKQRWYFIINLTKTIIYSWGSSCKIKSIIFTLNIIKENVEFEKKK